MGGAGVIILTQAFWWTHRRLEGFSTCFPNWWYQFMYLPHGQRNLMGYSPWRWQRVQQDWATKRTTINCLWELQVLEAAQVSIVRWKDKGNAVYTYNRILALENGCCTLCVIMCLNLKCYNQTQRDSVCPSIIPLTHCICRSQVLQTERQNGYYQGLEKCFMVTVLVLQGEFLGVSYTSCNYKEHW